MSTLLQWTVVRPIGAEAAWRWPTLNGKPPIVIGHRGAPGSLPEHTLASYQRAMAQGADFIEPDLVATRDGVLIARHDIDLTATTDVSAHAEFARRRTEKMIDGTPQQGWFADDFTLAEIKTLRTRQPLPFRTKAFDDRYDIPTLQEIIRLVRRESHRLHRTIGIIPEIKHPRHHRHNGLALEPRLLDVLRQNGLDSPLAPVIIQSFEASSLKRLRRQTTLRLLQLIDAPDLDTDGTPRPSRPDGFILSGDPRTYADLLTPDGLQEVAAHADGIGLCKHSLLPDFGPEPEKNRIDAEPPIAPPHALVAAAHGAGLFVHVWTFRDEPRFHARDYRGDPVAEYLEYFRLGIDGVFSDNPDTAVRARALLFPAAPPQPAIASTENAAEIPPFTEP